MKKLFQSVNLSFTIFLLISYSGNAQNNDTVSLDTVILTNENKVILKTYSKITGYGMNIKIPNREEKIKFYSLDNKYLGKRIWSSGFDDFIGCEMSNIIKEKINKKGLKYGLQKLDTIKTVKEIGYTHFLDTIIEQEYFEVRYGINTISNDPKWYIWDDSLTLKPINSNYKKDSIIIYEIYKNKSLAVVHYHYPRVLEPIKTVTFSSKGYVKTIKENKLDKSNYIKREKEYTFSNTGELISRCKSRWKMSILLYHHYSTKCSK